MTRIVVEIHTRHFWAYGECLPISGEMKLPKGAFKLNAGNRTIFEMSAIGRGEPRHFVLVEAK